MEISLIFALSRSSEKSIAGQGADRLSAETDDFDVCRVGPGGPEMDRHAIAFAVAVRGEDGRCLAVCRESERPVLDPVDHQRLALQPL